MALTRLLDKIDLRKDNIFAAFPFLSDEISNDIQMIKTLIEHGADINFHTGFSSLRSEKPTSAIHMACNGYVSVEVFQYLISIPSIDLNKELRAGSSVLSKALTDGMPHGFYLSSWPL